MSVFEGDSPPAVLLERLQVFRAGSYIHLLYLSMDKSCDDFRTVLKIYLCTLVVIFALQAHPDYKQ